MRRSEVESLKRALASTLHLLRHLCRCEVQLRSRLEWLCKAEKSRQRKKRKPAGPAALRRRKA